MNKYGIFEEIIRKSDRYNIPLFALLELTYKCNLHCRHCYINKNPHKKELTANQIKGLLNELKENNTMFLTLSGGELFTRKDIWEILEYANKKNWKAVFRYLLGKQSWSPFKTETVEFVELNFNFHPKSIRRWLESNNFKINRQLTVSHFRSNFLKRFVPLRLLVGMDSLAQLSGDLWQLTPSVFVKAGVTGESPVPQPSTFFRCPVCEHAALEETKDYCHCPDCSHRFEKRGGIYDFRLQATAG